MSLEIILAIISGAIAILGLLWTYFGALVNVKERLGKIENFDFTKMLERIVQMEVKIGLIWTAVESGAPSLIHHPTTPRKDELLAKFPNLTEEELCELKESLNGELHDLKKAQDPKVLAYALMVARIDSELIDRTNGKVTPENVQRVLDEACRRKQTFWQRMGVKK